MTKDEMLNTLFEGTTLKITSKMKRVSKKYVSSVYDAFICNPANADFYRQLLLK